MIQLHSIEIREFRGIRHLDLQLNGKNFAICGSNGTGKSGVVDAIEFALSGDVTRLSGVGSGELSVSKHAPHVDVGERSETARVTIRGRLSKIGKDVTISRSVATVGRPEIQPAQPDVIDAVAELARHPEFALSRREIAKYIVTQPSQRSTDVQNLLRLGRLDTIRKSLRTTASKANVEAKAAKDQLRSSADLFVSSLGLEDLDNNQILEAINKHRECLSLDPIERLHARTNIAGGVEKPDDRKPLISKPVAMSETEDAIVLLASIDEATRSQRDALNQELAKLVEDSRLFVRLRRQNLVRSGLALVDGNECPLCNTEWDRDELREHLEDKLQSAEEADNQLSTIKPKIAALCEDLESMKQALQQLWKYAKSLKLEDASKEIEELGKSVSQRIMVLRDGLETAHALNVLSEDLQRSWFNTRQAEATEQLTLLKNELEKLPDQSAESEARNVLTIASDRFRTHIRQLSHAARKIRTALQADAISTSFAAVQTSVLSEIYDDVSDDFTRFYRTINSGDEDGFEGYLIPEQAKLSLNVDFYGRGQFPPGAFHSEGHQDGMGLCLYLALAKHTLGAEFKLSILDDVLMSVDTGHRREVCRLLSNEFPETQFILTTHDRIWLNHMRNEKLVRNSVQFVGWDVNSGPKVFEDEVVWDEIRDLLANEKKSEAAAMLRRYLEHISHTICHEYRAPVRFKGDGRYDLGDLLPPGVSRLRKYLKDAAKAAESWDDDEKKSEATSLESSIRDAFAHTQAEQWAMNPAVHYNEWANFSRNEISSLVAAFEALVSCMKCQQCDTFLHLTHHGGKESDLRCVCGKTNYNLTRK